jgi:hypothetical protein
MSQNIPKDIKLITLGVPTTALYDMSSRLE